MVVVFASHTCLCPNFTTLVARTAAVWLPPCATHWHGKEAAMTSPRGLIKVIGHRKSWDKLMDELHTCFKLMQVCTLAARTLPTDRNTKKQKSDKESNPHTHLCAEFTISDIIMFLSMTSSKEQTIFRFLRRKLQLPLCRQIFDRRSGDTDLYYHRCGIGRRSNKKWWNSIIHQKILCLIIKHKIIKPLISGGWSNLCRFPIH